MFSFAPYRHIPNRLEDFLPWGMLVASGVTLNKDGSFQTTARFRGPDVRACTPEELVSFTARANNVFRRLGRGWAVYLEADRRELNEYPDGAFEDDLSRLVDSERAAAFEQSDTHFETVHHLTLQWTPAPDSSRKASAFFFEVDQRSAQRDTDLPKQSNPSKVRNQLDRQVARDALETFQRSIAQAFSLFAGLVVDFHPLDDDETLTYLKGTVSPSRTSVRAPAEAAFLDNLLCDAPLIGGVAPMLGDRHLRLLTIKGFPPFTHPGVLDDLNASAMPYRWMTRFASSNPIFEHIGDIAPGPIEFFANLPEVILLTLAGIIVIAAFFVLSIQLFVLIVEFKITTLAGFVLVPFAFWRQTTFLAERVLGNVISSGIKVLVIAVIIGIGSTMFEILRTALDPDDMTIEHRPRKLQCPARRTIVFMA